VRTDLESFTLDLHLLWVRGNALSILENFFFSKQGQKLCPDLLIKEKFSKFEKLT
jgi:hypothetical protein